MASGLSFAYRCVERVFLWPTSVPMVYRGTFLLASQEQNVSRQRVENDFVSSVGDAVIQAQDRYGLGEGIAQSALGYRFALVGKDKLGRLLRGDAFQHGYWLIVVHVGDALAHLAVNVDEAVRKVQIFAAGAGGFPQTHTRVCGEQGNPVYAAGQVLEQIEQPVGVSSGVRKRCRSFSAGRSLSLGTGPEWRNCQSTIRFITFTTSIRIRLIVAGARDCPKGIVLPSLALWIALVIMRSALKDSS